MTVRDGYGLPLPESQWGVFGERKPLLDWCEELQQLGSALLELEPKPWMAAVDLKQIRRHLAAVHALVKLGIPFERCDCHPDQLDCPKCEGRRWITAGDRAEANQGVDP